MAQALTESWRSGAVKALERENASLAGAIRAQAQNAIGAN